MFALVYVSQSTVAFDDAALETLAQKASEKNGRLQITGYLNFNRARTTFFQYLEGPEQAVLDLMAEIERDKRHRIVNAFRLGDVATRLFPDWNMRSLDSGFFHMIRMEDVLETVLLTMSERTFDREQIVATVMRMTKQIAKRRTA
jgi:di/tripeptidase